ncbi:hypothetical protein A9P44_14325 [Paenibacillus polymyxa]|nr:hypothetical protein [Paenibacillus polymyxa]OBA05873.1 hypothetical protein A9P44_14325 [Paenibacillus polymyxa]
MKKYQKSAISLLSTMAMLLAPTQAAFADEVATTTNPPSQETKTLEAQGIDLFASNPYPGYFDQGISPYIYMTGIVTITFNARVLGDYNFTFSNQNGTLYPVRWTAHTYGSQVVTVRDVYGYQRISATSPDGGGGEFNIRY